MTDNAYFFEYMKELLGARYDEFIQAYESKPRHKGLRVNTLKTGIAEFLSAFGELKSNPLCSAAFYTDIKPSLDPFYHAGLYYMQEPSASAAVAAFENYIGRRVLDLCAAPGGKSTQAAAFNKSDIIFCNDPDYKRTHALVENIERLGVSNAVVTCNTAKDFRAAGFDGYFDSLIVDAPCSGGGMMRYEEVPFTRDIVNGCAARQRTILADAVHLLREGGYMLYSTCTFAREENEDNILYLQALGMSPVDIELKAGSERGIDVKEARRVYPMSFDGEGHFYCVLQKTSEAADCDKPLMRSKKNKVKLGGLSLEVNDIGGRVILPLCVPDTKGLNVIRAGTPVFDGNEPSHALTHALSREQAALFGTVELGEHAAEYISGKEIYMTAPRGNLIATYKGYALGLVKCAPSGNGELALKNKYPKGLRINA
ncbi:MAG: hypothetical protein HDT28_08625 [Clostridiales bacterium]|nr:hypothetical protein [Clostridiales bacterium]